MSNRAFFIRPIKGRWGKTKGFVVSDGYNDMKLGLHDYFTIIDIHNSAISECQRVIDGAMK